MIYHISGTVGSSNSNYFNCLSFNRLKIKAYKVTFGTLTEIGDGDIDSEGAFEFEAETDAVAVIVKLFYVNPAIGEIFIAQSDSFCHHDPIDVTFAVDERKFTTNIYVETSNRIGAFIDVTPETIVPLTVDQIKELSCLTCVTANTIKRFQAAYRLFEEFLDFDDTLYTETEDAIAAFKAAPETSLPLLFALLKDDFDISIEDIFTYSGAQFVDELSGAVSENEISESLANTDNKNRLIACRNGLLFNAKDNTANYDAKLIHLSDNTYNDKKALLNDALNAGGLSAIISLVPEENSAQLLKVIPLIELDQHLMHYPLMLDIAVASVDVGDDPDYYDLTLEGTALWEGLIVTYPAQYISAVEYAAAIYESIGGSRPSARLSKNLDGSGITDASTLKAVLDEHRSFNIDEHSVSSYFTSVAPAPNYLAPETMLKMQALQRSVKLSGDKANLNASKVMLENELTSSYAITRRGKSGFVELLYASGIEREISETIYCRATAMNSTVSMLMTQYMRYESPDAMMPFSLKNPEFEGDPLPNLPDLESLFGNLDTCNCSDCQSVYSPAAYLTDLLHWLGTSVVCSPAYGSTTGFDALMEMNGLLGTINRRKDIRYLKLNCKNTNTLVPYIDLVNEILSVNVLIDVPGYTASDVIDTYKTLQTTKTADELLLQPEHRFPDAEALLKSNYFQWALPYDASYDESTAYLKQLEKPYADLVHDFTTEASQHDNWLWSQAFLGLNPNEAQTIQTDHTADADFWKKYWGLETADLTDDAVSPATPNVGAVLKSASLTLNELKEILSAFYINGSDQIEVIPYEDDACDVDKYTFMPKFTIEVADRFMRFLRLKRKSGLSMPELDLAIINHSPVNGIDQDLLKCLSSCMAFAQQYNLAFTDVEIFFSVNGYNSLYNALTRSGYFNNKFLNPLLPAEYITFFSTDVFTIHVNDLTNADKQKLARVFNVSIPAIDAIIAYALVGNPLLSLTNLAVIQRYGTLMNCFQIDAPEFSNIIGLCGDPFTTTPIHKTIWDFARFIGDYYKLGIKASELIPLVQGDLIYDLSSPELDVRAHAEWDKLEKAYTLARLAHPEKTFDNVTTYLPVQPADKTYFEDLIVDNIRLSFGLNFADTKKIITAYSSTWLENYIKDPEGLIAMRNWANRATDFKPVFRLLERIAKLSVVCGLDEKGVSSGVEVELGSTIVIPSDNFYWMSNTFRPIVLSDLTWIRNATIQATLLDISQTDYFISTSDLLSNDAARFSDPPDDDGIIQLFDLLGALSVYKDLTVFEFTQTFLRGRIIATNNKDLVEVIKRFDGIFNTVKTLGYNVTDGWSWVWNATSDDYNYVADYSSDIRRVLNNRYANFKAWSDVIVPIQNGLRSRMRDAFVALYIGTRGFKNENAIYAYYLLDTQMAPCNQTSRIVAAVSSTQLLVHRALLGLEAHVCMDDDDRNEWEWRKNYRVWEANRKVFLYPENWIDPSLRNNKTAIFKNAEDLLQQDEINQQNSEQAFAGYLTGLNDVAHLDIRATYMEVPDGLVAVNLGKQAPPETLHVFARSWNPPYIYYYRSLKNNVWTAWEKMELETDSDHLIPVMFNRKLYAFFPMMIEKQHQIIKNGDMGAPYLEIKMCYTKLDFGKWSNKKVLNGTLQAGGIASINLPNTDAGLINKLGRYDTKGRGNGINTMISGVTYRGNMVWDCTQFNDYAYVSLNKEAFYFWPEVNSGTGDLTIHCRRDFDERFENYHDGYTEMAYEWGFKIGACDEKVEIVPPVITETSSTAQRFLARPYMTLPYYQQMKRGKDAGAFDPGNPGNDGGVWVKTSQTHAPASNRILKKTNGDYVMTYPVQFKHNFNRQPFFFGDKRHSFYVNPNGKIALHEHPFTCKMLEALNRFGIDGLLKSPDALGLKRQAASIPFFVTEYDPATTVPTPYPIQDYDFTGTGAYSLYNWEVFFHSVSLIARQLRQSNQFEDAVKWINYIFDPSNRDVSLQDLRYWKIKPFLIDVTKGISYYMRLLSAPNLTAAELAEKKQWEAQIEAWRDHPFDPHLIASMRPRAYMLWTVMELINILTDWADYLFRQDTTESINESINLYVLASEILGERPKKVDRPAPPDYCYDDIINGLSAFSNAAIGFENYMTGLRICACDDALVPSTEPCNTNPALTTLPELIFCIPDNPNMTAMWDRVEDRLYKIRNCMNIDGKKRQVALFAPPIDPGLLVRATAMGLDLSDVLADLAAAPPHYRFAFLLQRANDFTNEVKSLGSQLLTALEKKDGEELSVLRQIHEQNILRASRTIKELQLEENKQNYTTLQYSKNLIQIRLDDYKNREYKNSREDNAQRQTQLAEGFMNAAQGIRALAGLLNLIPNVYSGTGALTEPPDGAKISILANAGAGVLELISAVNRNKASMSLTYAGYDRRQEEWNLQIKSATEELLQVDRQLLSAEIRIAMSEKELENHDLQLEQSAEMYDWLKSKYTNQALYTWMAGQLKTLHRKSYDLAYDMAKLAQQAFFKDLGSGADTAKINFGNWDSSRAGFFAGERLSIQLKELESSYMQHNTRDYELSKHISLALLDPLALEGLKTKGWCDIHIPELLFDLDYPGHYFRKIRSVAITIPGIAGPYATINATLNLNDYQIRVKPSLTDPAAVTTGSAYGESIATSAAQNDSGVFELSFRDERYMPFENKGAVSTWRLELSQIVRSGKETIRQFDFNTISDVIMHLNYTSKYDGVFAEDVKTDIDTNLNTIAGAINDNEGFIYAINLRHDMPNAWHQLKANGTANITIDKARLPYMIQAMSPVVGDVTVMAYTSLSAPGASYKIHVDNLPDLILNKVPDTKVYSGTDTSTIALNTAFTITTNAVSGALPLSDTDELIIAVKIAVS